MPFQIHLLVVKINPIYRKYHAAVQLKDIPLELAAKNEPYFRGVWFKVIVQLAVNCKTDLFLLRKYTRAILFIVPLLHYIVHRWKGF